VTTRAVASGTTTAAWTRCGRRVGEGIVGHEHVVEHATIGLERG
jgi:hypothetical protein